MQSSPEQRGFALLEVLVAFVIAAAGFAALVQGIHGGLRSAAIAAHIEEALLRAQSRLAQELDPRPGETAGDDGGGFTWRMKIREAAVADLYSRGKGRVRLYSVAVAISWRMDGSERQVVLETNRAVTGPASLAE